MVTVTFSESMNPSTLSAATFELRDAANAIVPGTVSYSPATRTATLLPTQELAYSTIFTARVRGGVSGAKDVAGNALAADFTWSFTFRRAAALVGPGGPILVVSSAANPFSRYYAEILRTEGLNAFAVEDVSALTADAPEQLRGRDCRGAAADRNTGGALQRLGHGRREFDRDAARQAARRVARLE